MKCTLRYRATGECVVALFDYAIGADGLCSTVREHARRSPAVASRVALIGDARRVVLGEPDFGRSRVKYGARQAMLDGAALGRRARRARSRARGDSTSAARGRDQVRARRRPPPTRTTRCAPPRSASRRAPSRCCRSAPCWPRRGTGAATRSHSHITSKSMPNTHMHAARVPLSPRRPRAATALARGAGPGRRSAATAGAGRAATRRRHCAPHARAERLVVVAAGLVLSTRATRRASRARGC